MGSVLDFRKLHVCLLGELLVPLKKRPELFHRHILCILDENHAVRVAHGNAGHGKHLARRLDRLLNDARCAKAQDRNALAFKDRLAHIDTHAREPAARKLQARHEDARARLDREFRLAAQPFRMDDAREAADAVATHLRLRAVRIEDAHAKVRLLRRQHKDQPVRADAIVPVTDPSRKRRKVIRELLPKAVHKDEIVAAALPFCKGKRHILTPRNVLRGKTRRTRRKPALFGGFPPTRAHLPPCSFPSL